MGTVGDLATVESKFPTGMLEVIFAKTGKKMITPGKRFEIVAVSQMPAFQK